MFVKALAVLSGFAGGMLVVGVAQADAIEALARVSATAVGALRAEIGSDAHLSLEAVALDSRLRLPACSRPLTGVATVPRGSQPRALVRVQCGAPAWSLNVAVEIKRRSDVLVLKRSIGRGEYVLPADVDLQSRELPGLVSPFLATIAELSGRPARRTLPAGTAVTADSLNPALLIHRGQNVTLTAIIAGIEVRAPGLALADASANQRLRVQNAYSLKIVEGTAETGGVVRVNP